MRVQALPPSAMNGSSAASVMELSEENLRVHNAACPKSDGYFQVNLIRQERAREREVAAYRELFGDTDLEQEGAELDGLELEGPEPGQEVATQEATTRAVVQLYPGALASLETPMNRFLAVSPANDTHPWLARTFMEDTGIEPGSLEDMDMRRIASDLLDLGHSHRSHPSETCGSPRQSSDTLSFRDMRALCERRRDGPRVRKRVVMRRQRPRAPTKPSPSSSLTLTNEDASATLADAAEE